ncbi:hypothetical protein M153_3400005122 [Pseudoloma neurophilia]|uniref:Uncharacterized protein n=1 Tax=Pseudoloma neurophilia TaxID=146866 RepID=A0A0R0LY08_9MICR|nr:hypothetical protein M153_3400005122 [Pseudoloma neurophilia]
MVPSAIPHGYFLKIDYIFIIIIHIKGTGCLLKYKTNLPKMIS